MDYDLRFGRELGLGSSSLTLKKDIVKFTVAFWMKVASDDNADPGTPLSYAVEHDGNRSTLKSFLFQIKTFHMRSQCMLCLNYYFKLLKPRA